MHGMSLALLAVLVCVQHGVDTEDHHVLVTCALCSADECPVLSPGLCNDLVLRGVDGVGTVLCLALESGEVLSQEF